MTDVTELLARLADLRAKATPGEWALDPNDNEVVVSPLLNSDLHWIVVSAKYAGDTNSGPVQDGANAALIVAAVNAIAPLTAEIERLRAENAAMKEGLVVVSGFVRKAGKICGPHAPKDTARDQRYWRDGYRHAARMMADVARAALAPAGAAS